VVVVRVRGGLSIVKVEVVIELFQVKSFISKTILYCQYHNCRVWYIAHVHHIVAQEKSIYVHHIFGQYDQDAVSLYRLNTILQVSTQLVSE